MKKTALHLLLATCFSAFAAGAFAQAAAGGEFSHAGRPAMEKREPGKMRERMQERMAQHQVKLKEKLKLTSNQEGAWTNFVAATTPASKDTARPDRAELQKLSTPERLDKMKAMHDKHMADMNAAMTKRIDATKALYAVLTPEQQKIFDAHGMPHQGHGMMQNKEHSDYAVGAKK